MEKGLEVPEQAAVTREARRWSVPNGGGIARAPDRENRDERYTGTDGESPHAAQAKASGALRSSIDQDREKAFTPTFRAVQHETLGLTAFQRASLD